MSVSTTIEQRRSTSVDQVHRSLTELSAHRQRYAQASLAERIELALGCLQGAIEQAPQWVDLAWGAKATARSPALAAEEIATGPAGIARYVRLLVHTLRHLEATGQPPIPSRLKDGPDGRLLVQVMPAGGLYDALVFQGFKAWVWMRAGVNRDNLAQHVAGHYRGLTSHPAKIALVLGAGNVSSIPATDAFSKLFQEGKLVLLKMNPVNDYLGPVFEQVLSPLIKAGYLRIVYGGGDVGAAAIAHDLVDEVHITGSIDSYNNIVWGPAGPQRLARLRDGQPLLTKPITAELGNVSPWIVVPGPYSEKQLAFQAENVSSSITNNASFNCVATKVIVTWRRWSDRHRFLDLLDATLSQVPPRRAYYPGAKDRYRQFTGNEPPADESGALPWTVLRDVDPESSPHFIRQESFVCVCVEVSLDAASEEEFLERAVDFVNQRLWGTLCAALTVHPRFRRRAGNEQLWQSCLARLEYGAIGVNHWPGLIYAMMSPPWGGFPSGTLADPQSGIGWVHNTNMLDAAEKTVLEGPLTIAPKPFWFPTHRNPEPIAWKLLELYRKPSLWNLTKLLGTALRSA